MSEKPLRHEEYLAMAEENRRLKAENARLVNRPARMKRLKRALVFTGCDPVAAVGLFVFSCFVATPFMKWAATPSRPQPARRTTPCYFVRHEKFEAREEKAEPWKPYYLFRSGEEGGCNHFVCASGSGDNCMVTAYTTKDEAWAFAVKWKLEMCK